MKFMRGRGDRWRIQGSRPAYSLASVVKGMSEMQDVVIKTTKEAMYPTCSCLNRNYHERKFPLLFCCEGAAS